MEQLGLMLYGLALILLIYIVINIIRTKTFNTDDAIATLGIVVSVLLALRITPPTAIPPVIIPTNIPSQSPTTVVTTLYDDFNDSNFDGSFNPSLWQYWIGNRNISQQGGTLVISTNATNLPSLIAQKFRLFSLDSQIFYEAKLKSSSTAHSGSVDMKINVDLPGGDYWDAECNIASSTSDTMGWAFCSQGGKNEGMNELGSTGNLLISIHGTRFVLK